MGWHRRFKRGLARSETRERSSPGFGRVFLWHLTRGKRGLIGAIDLHEEGLARRERLFWTAVNGTEHLGMASNVALHGSHWRLR